MVSSIDGATHNVHVTQSASRILLVNTTYLARTISALAILISAVRLRATESIKPRECGIVWRCGKIEKQGKITGKREVIKL